MNDEWIEKQTKIYLRQVNDLKLERELLINQLKLVEYRLSILEVKVWQLI